MSIRRLVGKYLEAHLTHIEEYNLQIICLKVIAERVSRVFSVLTAFLGIVGLEPSIAKSVRSQFQTLSK